MAIEIRCDRCDDTLDSFEKVYCSGCYSRGREELELNMKNFIRRKEVLEEKVALLEEALGKQAGETFAKEAMKVL